MPARLRRARSPSLWHSFFAGFLSDVRMLRLFDVQTTLSILKHANDLEIPEQRTIRWKISSCLTFTIHRAYFSLDRPYLVTRHFYLLMSSLASRRFSSGSRNGLVWSGAPLMACVNSFVAVGKSPLFESTRASARWLIQ